MTQEAYTEERQRTFDEYLREQDQNEERLWLSQLHQTGELKPDE